MTQTIKVWSEGHELEIGREKCYFTDRSRQIEQCDRRRYLRYHAGPAGRGVDVAMKSEDLLLGSAVHAGLEDLLVNHHVEGASEMASAWLRAQREQILVQDDEQMWRIVPEVAQLLVEEQAALAEALVYAFGRRQLPQLMVKYEVVSLEEEIAWPLWQDETTGVMMSRPDAILRDRQSRKLYPVSYKTIKDFDEATIEGLVTQTQNFTEGHACYHRYGEWPAGILYFYFLKGAKYKDKELGWKRYTNSLVRPWFNEQMSGGTPRPQDFRMEYERYVPSTGKNERLGRGWSRVNVWQIMDMSEWLSWLDEGLVDPIEGRDWLGEAVADPAAVAWDARYAQRWLDGAIVKERNWAFHSQDEPSLYGLDEWARPNDQACYGKYGKRCPYFGVCWRDETIDEQLVSGRMGVREANHEMELGD